MASSFIYTREKFPYHTLAILLRNSYIKISKLSKWLSVIFKCPSSMGELKNKVL